MLFPTGRQGGVAGEFLSDGGGEGGRVRRAGNEGDVDGAEVDLDREWGGGFRV